MYRTYSQKKSEIEKNWLLIDATDLVVGRLAATISHLLRGKHKPTYTPHMDGGDCIVVINADKIKFSGKKLQNKIYYRHTGYPGGIKSTTPEKILKGAHPDRVLKLAVKRMLDDGPMARQRMKNLYVYRGSEHKHAAQQPQEFDVLQLNKRHKLDY